MSNETTLAGFTPTLKGRVLSRKVIELYLKIFLTSRTGETTEESKEELYARYPEWKQELPPVSSPSLKAGVSTSAE